MTVSIQVSDESIGFFRSYEPFIRNNDGTTDESCVLFTARTLQEIYPGCVVVIVTR